MDVKKLTLLFIIFIVTLSSMYILNGNYRIGIKTEYPIAYNSDTRSRTASMKTSHSPRPHQHLYYLRTHKTGSTTMHNILAEYCRSHDLLPLLPSNGSHINQGGKFYSKQVMMAGNARKYEMIFSHHIYDSNIFKYLHNDTFRITSLREPFSNFISAFLYYKNRWKSRYLTQVPTKDPITEFLRHPKKYDSKWFNSWTNNRQSMDMGFDLSKSFDNITYIKEFVQLSDRRFDLVLIMEYFDEGLVIMKRTLHWKTEDILYYTKNAGTYYDKDKRENITSLDKERRKLHANFSQPDIMLHEHFLNRFKMKMAKAIGLKEEVDEFRNILEKFRNFCDSLQHSTETLFIPAGKWNNEFQLTYFKCKMLIKKQDSLIQFMKERQAKVSS